MAVQLNWLFDSQEVYMLYQYCVSSSFKCFGCSD